MQQAEKLELKGQIASVQSLRGIAALFVVLQHVCFLQRGSFGVDIFFLISGFIMMYTTGNGSKHFLLKRVIRIVPLYYLMTFLSFGVLLFLPGMFDQTTADPMYLVYSLLCIPFEIGGAAQPLLRVGWTVNYEMLFYLIFFLSLKISVRYRGMIAAALLGMLAATGAMFPHLPQPFHFWTDSIILEFAVGIGLYYLYRAIYSTFAGGSSVPMWFAAICLALSTGLFGFLWWSYESPEVSALPEIVRFGVPAVLIFTCFFVAGLRIRFPRVLIRLGDITFSIYMLHYYPMRLLSKLIGGTMTPNFLQICMTIGVIALCIAAAYVCYLLIEVRFTGFLRKKLLRD